MGQVFVAGHRGLVGSAICRRLATDGISPLLVTRDQLGLTDQNAVESWFATNDVEEAYLVGAKVGRIRANEHVSR